MQPCAETHARGRFVRACPTAYADYGFAGHGAPQEAIRIIQDGPALLDRAQEVLRRTHGHAKAGKAEVLKKPGFFYPVAVNKKAVAVRHTHKAAPLTCPIVQVS